MNKRLSLKLFLLVLGQLSLSPLLFAQEIALTTDVTNEENGHHTFALADGEFAVVFMTNVSLADDRDLYFQRITDDLEIYSQVEEASTRITGDQGYPVGVGLTNGGFAIFLEDHYGASNFDVMGIVFDSSSTVVNSTFNVSDVHGIDIQGFPHTCRLTNGDIIVAWHSLQEDSDSSIGVRAYRFSSAMERQNYIQLNANHVAGIQAYAKVAALSNGGFVAVWMDESGRDGDVHSVFG